MKNLITIPVFALGLMAHTGAWAYKSPDKSNGGAGVNVNKALTAGCLPPSTSAELALNNVRTTIHSGGDMWWDLKQFGKYEIPKGSGKHALYVGTLWIGGVDVNGQLKLAAQRYRSQGVDYYTGPLTEGEAEITPEKCKEFDRLWKITRAEAALHRVCKGPNPPAQLCASYVTPPSISEWPATTFKINTFSQVIGNSLQYFVAPFVDVDGDEEYNPENGDYPGYDLDQKIDCRTNRTPYLRGDETLFWVFNDKGNIHNETQSNPIGMEVRAQAFAFSTNDEINNMTFYNYELINRGTTTLFNCYFGVNTDADLGYAYDDFVGCDVQRGFGYVYNGDDIDAAGTSPAPDQYGANPPAVGIDFFEGPFADPNNKADKFDSSDVSTWLAINGLGYRDTIKDNERIGMRRFVYYNNASGPQGDPEVGKAIQYYNYLRGFWKNNTRMVFGGTGFPGSAGATSLESDFMFPGDSDPIHWGTKGINAGYEWSEEQPGVGLPRNAPGDRRFVQSSGPFTLLPGAVNDITTGAVWARATNGSPFESVKLVRKADDKAQQLFENCFRILDGPDAPDLTIQELDRELILYWTNSSVSNNYLNKYSELDYSIDSTIKPEAKRKYNFQGYLVYQLANANVTVDDRLDPNKMRLVAQCDIKDFDDNGNPIGRLINYRFDLDLGVSIPVIEVNGANQGIFQSLRVQTDQFATGINNRLVNHKTYYFMVLAYGYNEYKKYDPNDPFALDGQKKPFILGRKAATGPIQVVSAIPHIPAVESYGTIVNSFYGDMPEFTRIEGNGNGNNYVDITPEMEKMILNPPYFVEQLTYQRGSGPVSVKVIDALSLEPGTYYLKMLSDPAGSITPEIQKIPLMRPTSKWIILSENMKDTVAMSETDIASGNEQILFSRQTKNFLGLSASIRQSGQPGQNGTDKQREVNNGLISASMQFADGDKAWLGFVPDVDGFYKLNWILAGTQTQAQPPGESDIANVDNEQVFERISFFGGGGLAPFGLCSARDYAPGINVPLLNATYKFDNLQSVDIVLTSDKSKWTRCPVLETADKDVYAPYVHPDLGPTVPRKLDLRRSPSVDKNGRYATVDGTATGKILSGSSNNPEDANFVSNYGMGWFPGYAISVETGERLNMAFGEDSYLTFANGRDMLFNPLEVQTQSTPDGGFTTTGNSVISEFGDVILGGKHFLYVFGAVRNLSNSIGGMPRYDEGRKLMEYLRDTIGNPTDPKRVAAFRACMWTGIPMKLANKEWLGTEARIKMRISKPYARYLDYNDTQVSSPSNDNWPMYKFTLNGLAPVKNDRNTLSAALDLINVVPNPYYSYSSYENNKLDTRVKITNLPPECTITIYNSAGTLVRRYTKADNSVTSQDWDLRNYANIPIASGIYIIHIRVPEVGDKIIKWFGVMRPTDLSGL